MSDLSRNIMHWHFKSESNQYCVILHNNGKWAGAFGPTLSEAMTKALKCSGCSAKRLLNWLELCHQLNKLTWENVPQALLERLAMGGSPAIRIKCECGSDSVYGKNNTLHSHWCPKYNG